MVYDDQESRRPKQGLPKSFDDHPASAEKKSSAYNISKVLKEMGGQKSQRPNREKWDEN